LLKSGKGAIGVKRLSYSSIGLTLALGLAQSALAQTSPTIEGNVFTLSMGADVSHDSNVARASAAAAAQRGLVLADDKLAPSADILLQRVFGRNKLGVTGSAGYQFYRQNKTLNRENINLQGYGDVAIASCALHLASDYERGQSDLANLALDQNANVINTQTTVGGSGNLACGDEIGLRPTANLGYRTITNTQTQRKVMDRQELNYGGGMEYAHPSIGTLALFVDRRETRFTSVFLSDGRKAGFDIMSYGGRFARDIGSRMRGAITLRYVNMQTLQPNLPSFNGLNWNVDLTADLLSRVQSKFGLSREVITNGIADAAYHVDHLYEFNHDVALSEKLHLKLGGNYKQRQFYGANLTQTNALKRDKTYGVKAGVNYELGQRLQWNLTAAYTKRDGNGTYYDYESFNILTGFRVKI